MRVLTTYAIVQKSTYVTTLVDGSWEYINHSLMYEYENWEQGRAVLISRNT
jgi:hypothetical protein